MRFLTTARRPMPLFGSFVGLFDIKLGVTIISLLALLNKAAGLYGILAVFTGGTIVQISLYIYSVLTICAILYGLKGTGEESPRAMLTYAHLLAIDHLVATAYLVVFGISWFVYNPHDGESIVNSAAQASMMEHSSASTLTDEQRHAAAQQIWREERGVAFAVLLGSYLLRIYFVAIVYSFALHLRRGTYTSLPLSKPPSVVAMNRGAGSGAPAYRPVFSADEDIAAADDIEGDSVYEPGICVVDSDLLLRTRTCGENNAKGRGTTEIGD